MMLDEMDKLGADHRSGDPAAALLEVLDPAPEPGLSRPATSTCPFDLSKVIFIATANYMDDVPPALRDRLEVIRLPGYTDREKQEIAQRYLIPRQTEENGVAAGAGAVRAGDPSRASSRTTRAKRGVRGLERQIGAVCRHLAALVAEDKPRPARITVADPRADPRADPLHSRGAPDRRPAGRRDRSRLDAVGGGEIMPIEALRYPGKGGDSADRPDRRRDARECAGGG